MKFINSLSLSPDSKDWLANSRQPRILHVFDHACNLVNERGEILSIVTPQIGNGPFHLVIEEDILFSDHLNAQSPISIHANQLDLGDLTINIGGAKLWSPRPDWDALHARRDNILNQTLSLLGSDLLATTLPTTNFQLPTSNLCTFLVTADLPNCIDSAKQLAGLGIGLTPAGDDFILGAVLAAWIIHPPEIAGVLAREITSSAAPLTTSLSAAWLRCAGRGEAGILWHNFFNALRIEDSSAVQLQFNKLLSIGHTSGADSLAGFVGMFICYAESETNSHPP